MSEMMNTTQISHALGMTVPAETLHKAGCKEGGRNKRATLWADDWQTICEKLGAYIEAQGAKRPSLDAPAAPKPKKEKPTKAAAAAKATNKVDTSWDDEDDGEL